LLFIACGWKVPILIFWVYGEEVLPVGVGRPNVIFDDLRRSTGMLGHCVQSMIGDCFQLGAAIKRR
jgi:hypothetical protein